MSRKARPYRRTTSRSRRPSHPAPPSPPSAAEPVAYERKARPPTTRVGPDRRDPRPAVRHRTGRRPPIRPAGSCACPAIPHCSGTDSRCTPNEERPGRDSAVLATKRSPGVVPGAAASPLPRRRDPAARPRSRAGRRFPAIAPDTTCALAEHRLSQQVHADLDSHVLEPAGKRRPTALVVADAEPLTHQNVFRDAPARRQTQEDGAYPLFNDLDLVLLRALPLHSPL